MDVEKIGTQQTVKAKKMRQMQYVKTEKSKKHDNLQPSSQSNKNKI